MCSLPKLVFLKLLAHAWVWMHLNTNSPAQLLQVRADSANHRSVAMSVIRIDKQRSTVLRVSQELTRMHDLLFAKLLLREKFQELIFDLDDGVILLSKDFCTSLHDRILDPMGIRGHPRIQTSSPKASTISSPKASAISSPKAAEYQVHALSRGELKWLRNTLQRACVCTSSMIFCTSICTSNMACCTSVYISHLYMAIYVIIDTLIRYWSCRKSEPCCFVARHAESQSEATSL